MGGRSAVVGTHRGGGGGTPEDHPHGFVHVDVGGSNPRGLMSNFDPARSYSWPFVRWTGGYSGPLTDADLDAATVFDTTGFLNATNGGSFGWHLDTAGQTLSLTYTAPVPEPGTLLLTGAVAVAGVAWRRRAVARS